MERSEIEKQVREIIADQSNAEVDKVELESTTSELGLDSFDKIEIVTRLEDVFDLEIYDDEIPDGDVGVKSIVDLIEKKLTEKSSQSQQT